jgi:predicted RNA binding protein YcfA (HicA-like mRNA interferase family)
LLLQEKRARMKILLVDPAKDIPVATINEILKIALVFYR